MEGRNGGGRGWTEVGGKHTLFVGTTRSHRIALLGKLIVILRLPLFTCTGGYRGCNLSPVRLRIAWEEYTRSSLGIDRFDTRYSYSVKIFGNHTLWGFAQGLLVVASSRRDARSAFMIVPSDGGFLLNDLAIKKARGRIRAERIGGIPRGINASPVRGFPLVKPKNSLIILNTV